MQSTAINMKQLLSCFTDESVTDDSVFLSPQGFREYDARWWYGFSGSDRAQEINLAGITAVGAALAHLMRQRGVDPAIIVGHDLRSYSFEVKTALVKGWFPAARMSAILVLPCRLWPITRNLH